MKPLSRTCHWNSTVVQFLRRQAAASVFLAALALPFTANAQTTGSPGVTPSVAQEDRAFLQSVAAGQTAPPADVATAPAATVIPGLPPQANGGEEAAVRPPRSKSAERPVVEKRAPAPAPIAAKTSKPKTIKREAPAASLRETEPRSEIASTRITTRKAGAPIKPFFSEEETLAVAPAPNRTRTVGRTRPSSGRAVEIRRAQPADHDDHRNRGLFDGDLFAKPAPGDRFFDRLFRDDD